MAEKPDDLIMRRRIETIRQQSQDWEWQQRMAVESFQEQEHERALQAVAVSLYQSPAFQRLLTVERNKRRPASHPSIIERRAQPWPLNATYADMMAQIREDMQDEDPDVRRAARASYDTQLRAMQANLDRMKKRDAELTRQAQRERAGYR